jgi:DNA-binding NtrC family response regulator
MPSPLILLIDDDAAVLSSLALLLKQAGYSSLKADKPSEALRLLQNKPVDLVIQDMNFSARQTSGEEGLQLLKAIKAEHPDLPVILISAWGSIALAVSGLQNGASDFITKPWSHQQVLQTIKTHLGLKNPSAQTPLSRADLEKQYNIAHIIGTDPQLLRILAMIGRVSATDAPVLVTGESGTGKELIAEAVHRNSPRQSGPLVRVNLGSIPVNLFESELFGHVKGAFTDARNDRKGRFETAQGGTIFLDEIGDLDFASQVKLLRVLQDRSFEPVGSSQSRTADVRVVSATNRNLMEMVHKGEFREDLLYRLNLIAVHLPALRERRSDIPLLAKHFLNQAAKVYRRSQLSIQETAMQWLQQQSFPGNIRELRHLIERAVIISPNNTLDTDDFINCLRMEQQHNALQVPTESYLLTLEEMEKLMISRALEQYNGNTNKVAEVLGISRFALYRRLEKYGLHSHDT